MKNGDDLARWFVMVPWLAHRPGITVTEAAAHFRVHPARLLDELQRMCMIGADTEAIAVGGYGYLIEFDQDEAEQQGRITVFPSDIIDRPLKLTRGEATSLVVALRALVETLDDESAAHGRTALAKLERVAGGRQAHVEVALDSGAGAVREVVAAAVAAGRQLALVYDGASRGRTTRPVVDPVRTVVRGGAAYLQGWDVDQQGWRWYKVNRIHEASPTGTPVTDRGAAPDDWVDDAPRERTVLELAPAARFLVEYDPVSEVEETGDPDFPVRATLPLAAPGYLVDRLLGLAGDVRLVAPHPAQQRAAATARAALVAYDQLTTR
ncbi:helix-turn-helix transcriptional regulator [Propionibacteriaceae bacterium G57]|uniref:helix-turn-helix transcriptional regulator n=1 Tax=Aestuariimicrobium sp. G57 TaxID=3418485 RepID=UPI003DA79232